jgi:uncharacterized membrane protein HdeD (DUF308 family)
VKALRIKVFQKAAMKHPFARFEKNLYLRGALSLLFAILVFFLPKLFQLSVIWVFAAYAFVEAILSIQAAFHLQAFYRRWWILLLDGFASLLVALLFISFPQMAIWSLYVVLVVWVMLKSLSCVDWGMKLAHFVKQGKDLIILGFLGLLIALLMALQPETGLQLLISMVGIAAFIWGVALLLLAVKIHQFEQKIIQALLPRTKKMSREKGKKK